MKLLLTISLWVLLSTIHSTPTRAAWQLDGTPVSTAAIYQLGQRMVSDGAGGAIIVWADSRLGLNDIYAQRIDASGTPMWAADGVGICIANNDQYGPKIIADGAGGAIITWTDFRNDLNNDVYAQRVNASGVVQWAPNGVAISIAASHQTNPNLVADGSGGAIITWQDLRSGTTLDVYAQRVNAVGAVQWLANGVVISAVTGDQASPVIAIDGVGGAIIAWQDNRSGNYDIYAQRVNGAGAVQWLANGVSICNVGLSQLGQSILSDGSGGAIIAWQDFRNGHYDAYVQRVNAAGAAQWFANGVVISAASADQVNIVAVSDGAGGAILTWLDYRNGATADLYAQRILSNSSPIWAYNGLVVCNMPETQGPLGVVSDGLGGAIVTWADQRNVTHSDIYAQQLTAAGEARWGTNGVAVSSAAGNQNSPSVVLDAGTGALVAWDDNRSGSSDIYAQRIEFRYGYWGRPEPVLVEAKDNPNDQGGKVVLNWQPSGRDVLNQQTIYRYSVWRAIDEVAAQALASSGNALLIDTPVTKSAPAHARLVWRERAPAATYYWEQVGLQIANYSDGYSFLASTRQDSVAANTATTYFRVVAESGSALTNWPSNVLSAHSVDNLAPAAPLMLTAQRVGANVNLSWNRAVAPDLRDYSLYRKTSAGVTPVPIHFLASSEDTVAVDAGAPASALYYIVTAFDVHANQSAPSNEANVGATTGVGDTPSITVLTVLQNQPNPFAGRTDLRVGLPANSDISVDVFDVAGRRVRTQTFAQQKAGWQSLPFDARDDGGRSLASGVYFYRITAGSSTVTNKMVIAR